MNRFCQLIFITTLLVLTSCTKKADQEKPSYDRHGNLTLPCSVRDARGRGPYEPLGKMTEAKCQREISSYCKKKKYQQIHRHKGHFARGKFGPKIMIGTCP